jgi:hypothetical protein
MQLRRTTLMLAAATVLSGAGTVAAMAQQNGAPMFDPNQLPAVHGKVAQYDLTPRGDIDGLILDNGTEVHFAPDFGTQIAALVRPGDTVTVHGLQARAMPLVRAFSVTVDSSGHTVVTENEGFGHPGHRPPPPPPPHAERGQMLQDHGKVRMVLHGPRGELNGALLEDGTEVHLPPPEAQRLASLLQPGATVFVRGHGVANSLGRSIAAREIGSSPDQMTRIAPPPHPDGHRPPPPPPGGPGAGGPDAGGPGAGGPGAPPPPPPAGK